MAKAQRLARRSGLNRLAIGLPIRREALRVFSQRTKVHPPVVKWSEKEKSRAVRGFSRMECPLMAWEWPSRHSTPSPATKESAIRVATQRLPWVTFTTASR
jgi:hypothetical protein